jgi:hypothetical protein
LAEIRDPKIIAKKSAQLEMKEVQKYARRNVESSMTATIIPRTMREPQCNVSNSVLLLIFNIFNNQYVFRNQQWNQRCLLLYSLKS